MSGADESLLAEDVYVRLRAQILEGALPAGGALSVPRLAAEIGVSRSPVREAVQRLIFDGLAVHVPYAGAKVRGIDADSIREVFELREVLDALAARLAAERIDAAGLGLLEELLDQQRRRLTAAPDAHREAELDIRFHALIRDAAGNEPLRSALERIEPLSHLAAGVMWDADQTRRAAVAEHEAIAEAIRRGDAQAAERAAAAHVRALSVRRARRGRM